MFLKEKFALKILILLIPALFVTGSSLTSLWSDSVMQDTAIVLMVDEQLENAEQVPVLLAAPTTRPLLDLTAANAFAEPDQRQTSAQLIDGIELLGDLEEHTPKSG